MSLYAGSVCVCIFKQVVLVRACVCGHTRLCVCEALVLRLIALIALRLWWKVNQCHQLGNPSS